MSHIIAPVILIVLSILRYKHIVKHKELNKKHKISLVCFSIIYVIVFSIFINSIIIAITILRPYINQTTKPLSLEKAKGKCPIDLPDSATNVQFAKYRHFVAVAAIVKFKAPVDICKQHASKILELHNQQFPERDPISIQLQEIQYPPKKRSFPMLRAEWFDVQNIKNGLYGGKAESHSPQIWIDEEKETFYYCYTD